jgi:RecB family endonuclease NucS
LAKWEAFTSSIAADPFILYAKCDVTYEGRANSYLTVGNYLIIYKADGSLLIHGGDKAVPRNYHPPGTKISFINNSIIAKRKKETILININEILCYHVPNDWSISPIIMRRTEKDLVDKIVKNIESYIDVIPDTIIRERNTECGKIDIFAVDQENTHYIIEVKRVKATINHCGQLRKYLECFPNERVKGYIAAPNICKSAQNYMIEKGYTFLAVTFD